MEETAMRESCEVMRGHAEVMRGRMEEIASEGHAAGCSRFMVFVLAAQRHDRLLRADGFKTDGTVVLVLGLGLSLAEAPRGKRVDKLGVGCARLALFAVVGLIKAQQHLIVGLAEVAIEKRQVRELPRAP